MILAARELARALDRICARDALLRDVREVAEETGGHVWLVGGSVRNAALRRPAADIDLVAAGRVARLVAELERRWRRRSFRFRKRGVTTVRFVVAGRQVDLVDATRRGLRRDLERREATMNAVAFDLRAGRIADPLQGLRDLRRGRLRMPRAGVIREDPVRALRGARFLAQFPAFALDSAFAAEAASCARALRRASVERVRDELDSLLRAESPERGLATLETLGLLGAVLPELVPLRSCIAGSGRPDVWRHTLDCLARSAGRRRLPGADVRRDPAALRVLRWSLLLHDISKPETLDRRPDGRPTFHGHESLGATRADALLRRLRMPRGLRARVTRAIRLHLRPGLLADAGAPERGLRRLVRDAGEDLPLVVFHAACDALASGSPDAARRWRRLRAVLQQLLVLAERAARSPLPRLVSGDDVMRLLRSEPGPRIGRVLEQIREAQEDGRVGSRAQALALLRRLSRDDGTVP